MEQDIRVALDDIKASVKDGFAGVYKRIETLVTKDAFDANVARLDAADKYQAERLADHIKDSEVDHARLDGDISKLVSTLKWAVGLAVTSAAGLVATVAGIIVQYFITR